MFFIARCLFWLSIVYFHLPAGDGAGVRAGAFLDLASAHVEALRHRGATLVANPVASVVASAASGAGAGALMADLASQGADWCQAHGEACADAVLAAMNASPMNASPMNASPMNAGARGADTLTAGDRAAHWRTAGKTRG